MFLRFNGVWKRKNYEFKRIIVIFDSDYQFVDELLAKKEFKSLI